MTGADPGSREGDPPDAGRRPPPVGSGFYARIVPFPEFAGVVDPDVFVPLPDDWVLGLADVTSSTQAIAAGRYKAVNMAGASVISAVSNRLGHLDFPFVFGGDGAVFAVPPDLGVAAVEALAATVPWVGRALDLDLRGGALRIGEIRARGYDVRVARFAASDDVSYAMFAGGGLAWAETQLKAGALALPPEIPGREPDLTGLSCRFRDIRARNGVILSVLVRPAAGSDDPAFRELVAAVLDLAGRGAATRPVPVFGLRSGLNLKAIRLTAALQRGAGTLIRTAWSSLLAWAALNGRVSAGSFSAERYLREVVANSDFRKYADGLMLTLDCSSTVAASIEARLIRAERDGVASYGLHRQATATVTCVIPSPTRPDHIHFIDGASGGYAMAAQNAKARQNVAGLAGPQNHKL